MIILRMFSVIFKLTLSIIILCIIGFGFMLYNQESSIFPGAARGLVGYKSVPTEDIEVLNTQSNDGKSIVVWRKQGTGEELQKNPILYFYGNAESLQYSRELFDAFSKNGWTIYAMEYYGYGDTSGAPSEQALYGEADATVELIKNKEQVAESDIIVIGYSIGTGLATYIAEKNKSNLLVLFAPLTSVGDVVKELSRFREVMPLIKPFLRVDFPNQARVANLDNTCVIAAHGQKDKLISAKQAVALKEAYRGNCSFELFLEPDANHDNIKQVTIEKVIEVMKTQESNQDKPSLLETD